MRSSMMVTMMNGSLNGDEDGGDQGDADDADADSRAPAPWVDCSHRCNRLLLRGIPLAMRTA